MKTKPITLALTKTITNSGVESETEEKIVGKGLGDIERIDDAVGTFCSGFGDDAEKLVEASLGTPVSKGRGT